MADSTILCPSWSCEAGASLIGIVLANGSVAFSKDRIVIDAAFVETARQGRSPEKRFRFSSTCKRAGCVQWTDGKCGIVDRVIGEHQTAEPANAISEPFLLPDCPIRPQCRWHLQAGDEACRACPEVMTDERAETIGSTYKDIDNVCAQP
jgi:hypothetical protein